MKESFLLGVAGPTGSGKSTLAFGLQDRFPGQVTIVHLDDYFVEQKDLPVLQGELNWDDPAAIRYKDLASDLQKLKTGQAVTIMTADPKVNPDFHKTKQKLQAELLPRPLVVVEGFYSLYYPLLRQELDTSIYLKGDYKETVKRRVHPMWDHYRDNVLAPMHEQFVVPSAKNAKHVIDVSEVSKNQVLEQVVKLLPKTLHEQ